MNCNILVMMAQRRLLSEGPRFYNRVNELSLFGSVFKDTPQLNVILGGPNVGKSLLGRRVLQDGGHNVAHIDLRDEGFFSAYELHLALQGQFARFSQNMKKLIPQSIALECSAVI